MTTATEPVTPVMRIANAPCSWGALEFDVGEAIPYGRVLDEMAAAGYAGTELGDWGFMPVEPAALGDALAARRLSLVGAFVPVALAKPESHDAGRDVALKTARLLAATADDSVVVLSDANGEVPLRATRAGRITPAESLSAAGWDIFASGAEAIARAVRDETGVRTVFHPHCGGYVETEWELAALFDRTDPALLGLCLDTGHLSFGGCDPVDMARRYASRIWHVHFKDCEPTVAARSRAEGWDYLTAVRSGVFCELGKGQVDFATVLSVLRNTSAGTWIVVEQDVLPGLGSPAESAARNRAYLARLGV